MSPSSPSHRPSKRKRTEERIPGPSTSHSTADPETGTDLNATLGRGALAAYIAAPTRFPASRVPFHDDAFVAVRDLYPKSGVHLLVLPRSPARALQHPFDALADPEFLSEVKAQVARATALVAGELRRLHGSVSASDAERNAALNDDGDAKELPRGRDWAREVRAGVHARPSMAHLHVHVLSADRRSECLRHRKHYNSFATPFFVPLEDFPLAEDDVRRHPGREGYLERDLVCWRCGKGFGRAFKLLKAHLDEEYEAWRRE